MCEIIIITPESLCGWQGGKHLKLLFSETIFCEDSQKEFGTSLGSPDLSAAMTRNDLRTSDKSAWPCEGNLYLRNPSGGDLFLMSVHNGSMHSEFPTWPPGHADTLPNLIKWTK